MGRRSGEGYRGRSQANVFRQGTSGPGGQNGGLRKASSGTTGGGQRSDIRQSLVGSRVRNKVMKNSKKYGRTCQNEVRSVLRKTKRLRLPSKITHDPNEVGGRWGQVALEKRGRPGWGLIRGVRQGIGESERGKTVRNQTGRKKVGGSSPLNHGKKEGGILREGRANKLAMRRKMEKTPAGGVTE